MNHEKNLSPKENINIDKTSKPQENKDSHFDKDQYPQINTKEQPKTSKKRTAFEEQFYF